MSEETLKQMEDRWLLAMAATNPKTGQRITETDVAYQRQCHRLRVEIEERKAAEAQRPQMSQTQLEQLAWLDRLQGARTKEVRSKDGKEIIEPSRRMVDVPTPQGRSFQVDVDKARQDIYAGKTLSQGLINGTERELAAQGVTVPDAVHAPTPSAYEVKLAAQQGTLPQLPPSHFHNSTQGK